MALPRFEKLEPERQELLLQIAQQEFIEHGYEQASINRIIAQAGISKGAMYYYFEGKEDLFITLINHHVERNWEAIGPLALDALTPQSYWDELEAMMMRFVSFFFRDNPHLKMWRICQQLFIEPSSNIAIHERLARKQQFLSELVARGQQLGVVRSDLELALLVKIMDAIALTHERWISAHEQDPSIETLKARLKVRIDLIKRVCLPPEQLLALIPTSSQPGPSSHPQE